MYLFVLYFPFISSLLVGLFGRFFGSKGASIIALVCMLITLVTSLFIFYEVGLSHSVCHIELFNWFYYSFFVVKWGFLFDTLTSVMLIVVTSVSFLVHMFSIGYMSEDPHLIRFMSYLSLFTGFMVILVTGDNFLQLFLGWEGVGVCSYLLISFWYTRLNANKAAIKAIIVNKIGDVAVIIGIAVILSIFKSLDYAVIFSLIPLYLEKTFLFLNYDVNIIFLIAILLFIGCIGKSAQIGLHTWLPDAMEGPTPVSALIHAATMVTAGVFLVLRCSPIFEFSGLLPFITFIGALTAFLAATIGVFQNDLKKVIAYSTCSQLGYMVFACGLSAYSVSIFHLMNHAFFKALLFLSAGCVIHALMDEQDMRRMGGLIKILPLTYLMLMIGSLALTGFPFLSGYYSKDLILEVAIAKYTFSGDFAFWLGSVSALFTSYYSFRLFVLTFLVKPNGYRLAFEKAHDAPLIMAIPLLILAIGSIFIGYVTRDMFVGFGTDFWNNALVGTFNISTTYIESEFIPYKYKILPIVFSFLGSGLAILLCYFLRGLLLNHKNIISYFISKDSLLIKYSFESLKSLYNIVSKKWYFDILYNKTLVKYAMNFGYTVSFKIIDRGLIELLGPLGIVRSLDKMSETVAKWNTLYLYNYIFSIVISNFILCIYLYLLYKLDIFVHLNLFIIFIVLLSCLYLTRIKQQQHE